MRKIKIWLATIVLSFGNLVASAYDFSVDGISYNVTSETDLEVEVAKGVDRSYVKIPESVTNNGITYSVTSIGDMAFYGSYNLNLISIPSSVIYIGSEAFDQCTGLTDFTLPPNLIYIGGGAFAGCEEITSITIPSSVNYIGRGAFNGCYNLSSIKVEQGNTIYDSRNDCNAIINTQKNELICGCSSTVIPNNVISIGEEAFEDCEGLTSITIPNSVINIGEEAFSGCEGLASITIPNSVTSIGDDAFYECVGLTSLTIGSGVKNMWENPFTECPNLENIVVDKDNPIYDSRNNCNSVIETSSNELVVGCKKTTIPSNVTSIGYEAFYCCEGLTSITIPNSVTSIGYKAFYSCDGLTSITIPNSVISIDYEAFYGCEGLTSVHISDIAAWCNIKFGDSNPLEYAQHLFMDGKEIADLIIPNSVTSIGNQAFLGCSSLTSVTIPNSVTSIGDYAFEGCENLISVTSKAKNPPTLGYDVFDGTPVNNLYVPIGSKSAYEAASGWDWFENIVEMEIEIEEVPIVSANDVNIVNDGVTWLSINMENKKSILGFQFKLTLPDGIVVDTDKNGKLQSVLSSRCNGFTLGLTAQGDNNYKVDCISLQNKEITGTEGELVKIKLTTNGEVAVGNSTITLSDIKLTTTDGTETITLYPANYTSKIAVLNYNLGDVDGKDGVSVTDAVMVVQDMFYKTPSNFIRETADVNGDGRIDGSDVVCILDILRTSSSKTQKDEWLEAE